ncbi:inorganic phosphate transporter 1-4 /Pi cotransporter [Westerdykella ornata]|uniref:Inorganic phosphate transporter 1-4 /Pi cotransporter n=1 Tax=Westerdykella ornata TaxID=318751 RepID=A0A6A6J8R8_WESOR|nr:inorganic phosphate transporter 1-4 /Pi cotransporter [Westerdykella ornata]KAF2272594.1 inorganic phosphate transporter 1-4 /Pi cotransporter [Westerdykella ornata]
MGLRKWLNRPMRGHHLGVQDLTRGDEGIPLNRRRKWALQTIDQAPFQIWVVVVAGIGFLTDSFGLFALNVVTPMLGYVYWPENKDYDGVPTVPQGIKTGMMCATLAGTMLGQIAFGFAADILGRRKMYGLELVIVIVGTMLMIMSSNGEKNSMAVGGWLVAWRAIMGIGIGADYPLSAVITAEFAPRRFRARMMSWVFFAQPIGQLLANVLSLAAVEGFKSRITNTAISCPLEDPECFRAIDRLWRLVIGLGMIPAVFALAFRFTIPESPRYKLDVLRNVQDTFQDTKDYFDAPELDAEGGEVIMLYTEPKSPGVPEPQHGVSRQSTSSSEIAPDEVVESDGESDHRRSDGHGLAAPQVQYPPGDPNFVPPLASWEDAKLFFIKEKNWIYLLGTSLSWLFLDFAFYGLGLSSPEIVRHIWHDPDDPRENVFSSLKENSLNTLIMVSVGAVLGGAVMIKVIRYASPKVIQFWGFLVLFVLFIVTGSAWTKLLDNSRSGLIVLYVLCHIAFNLGPNVTTFIIPAEIFPTRYRCTCHGIAAAAGKLGSWLVQIFLAFAFKGQGEEKKSDWERKNFGHILQVMSAFMIAGAATTYFLVPETRDRDNKSRTLEVLAGGRVVLEELNTQRRREDEEEL